VLFPPIRHQLIFERCCDKRPEQSPNFNIGEIVYMFREESFIEALEVDIRAFKDCQATVAPMQKK
jgi:hypothetical protein